MFSGETVSSPGLLSEYTVALSKIDKIKAFIVPNMIDLITYLDNNGKYAVYTEGYINGIYCYLEIIGAPTTLPLQVSSLII